MNVVYITSTWTDIIQYFFPVFTTPTANIFLNLVTGWVLCTGRKLITRIIPFADPEDLHAHDAYHRLFPDAAWSTSELWRMLTLLLVKVFYRTGRIHTDLDDTVFHRSGRKVNGAGWWRDAVRSTGTKVVHAWGLNLVVVTLRVKPPWGGEPLGLPINMRLHHKNGTSVPDLAVEMLEEIASWLPARSFHCHADGFYATLGGAVIPNTHITSRMRRDANIYELPPKRRSKKRGRPRKRGKKLSAPQDMAGRIRKWKKVITCERGKRRERLVYSRKVIWYKVSRKPVLLVISRDPDGKEKDDFFFTTDTRLSGATVIGGFAGRWSIEDTFKNTKQFLGGQEPQTWKGKGPRRAAAISFWLYSVVWLWYLARKSRHRYIEIQPWYMEKSVPSFADALSSLRCWLWKERIKSMFGIFAVHDKKFFPLIKALSTAA
jgi:hypothetical protein